MKKFITAAGICCVAPLIILGIIFLSKSEAPTSIPFSNISPSPVGQEISIEGREHVPEGTKVIYLNSNPPTSGNHWPTPADWGF